MQIDVCHQHFVNPQSLLAALEAGRRAGRPLDLPAFSELLAQEAAIAAKEVIVDKVLSYVPTYRLPDSDCGLSPSSLRSLGFSTTLNWCAHGWVL